MAHQTLEGEQSPPLVRRPAVRLPEALPELPQVEPLPGLPQVEPLRVGLLPAEPLPELPQVEPLRVGPPAELLRVGLLPGPLGRQMGLVCPVPKTASSWVHHLTRNQPPGQHHHLPRPVASGPHRQRKTSFLP